jgi:hypothetical protein
MNKAVTFLLALAAVSAQLLPAQVVTPADSRTKLLGAMQSTLGNLDRPSGDYSGIESPFVVREKKAEIIPASQLERAVEQTGGERLPDETALKVIAGQFNPLGSLILGNRGLLKLAGGSTLEKGETFKAEIRGNVYEVEVRDVTSHGYTLSLGSASVGKNFIITTGATQ